MRARLRYWRRVLSAYAGGRNSHLTFWHGAPEVEERATPGAVDLYWQPFRSKADYPGPFDERGIPMLDYHGHVGLQYNPIAVAQWGLGNYNALRSGGGGSGSRGRAGEGERRKNCLRAADWLVENLEENEGGLKVWNHHFDWEYRGVLKAPWYSALSQGQGVSMLVRAHRLVGASRYLDAAQEAALSFGAPLTRGGVSFWDDAGRIWFEETVVDPPTHILNGFIWASWGLYDLSLHAGDDAAGTLFARAVDTLEECLPRFDMGFWSMYDLPGTRIRNPASRFYHALHVVQLRILHRLTGRETFRRTAARWDAFQRSAAKRRRATAHKVVFKVVHY